MSQYWQYFCTQEKVCYFLQHPDSRLYNRTLVSSKHWSWNQLGDKVEHNQYSLFTQTFLDFYQWTKSALASKISRVDRKDCCCHFPTMEVFPSTQSNVIPLSIFAPQPLDCSLLKCYWSALCAALKKRGHIINTPSLHPWSSGQSYVTVLKREGVFSVISLISLGNHIVTCQHSVLCVCMLNTNILCSSVLL